MGFLLLVVVGVFLIFVIIGVISSKKDDKNGTSSSDKAWPTQQANALQQKDDLQQIYALEGDIVGYIYDDPYGGTSYGGEPIGRLEADGMVYDDWQGGNPIGRVEVDGMVYDDPHMDGTEFCCGRVEADGMVYNDPHMDGTEFCCGRVEADGIVYDDWHDGSPIGRVVGKKLACAAALLLLLKK
jgi:hypothetical protein